MGTLIPISTSDLNPLTLHSERWYLALILRKALLERLDLAGHDLDWAAVVSDLDALKQLDVTHQGKRFRIRTEARGTCNWVFRAVGVALPQTVRRLPQVN